MPDDLLDVSALRTFTARTLDWPGLMRAMDDGPWMRKGLALLDHLDQMDAQARLDATADMLDLLELTRPLLHAAYPGAMAGLGRDVTEICADSLALADGTGVVVTCMHALLAPWGLFRPALPTSASQAVARRAAVLTFDVLSLIWPITPRRLARFNTELNDLTLEQLLTGTSSWASSTDHRDTLTLDKRAA
jgi:hypothetical protein